MAALTENNNEHEVEIIATATGEEFKEYVKLGGRESRGDTSCERYIVARPGAQFEVQIALLAGFCFKHFDEVEAHLYFGKENSDYCTGHLFTGKGRGFHHAKKDYKAVINCVNMEQYGEDIVGAPFVFSSLDVDEDLSNETDVTGVNPADIGHFSVEIYRLKMARQKENLDLTKRSTDIWDAKKIDQLNYKKHGITSSIGLGENRVKAVQLQSSLQSSNAVFIKSKPLWFHFKYRTFEFLDGLDVVPYPPPLYYSPWKSLTFMERQWALKELPSLSRLQEQSTVNNTPFNAREPREWRPWNSMQPVERRNAFSRLQKEQKAFERGEVKQQISNFPSDKIIVLDDDGIVQHPESINLEGTSLQQSQPHTATQRGIKEEPIELDDFPSTMTSKSQVPQAKRRRVHQGPTDLDTMDNTTIKQEVIDVDAMVDEEIVLLEKEATIKYDVTEIKEEDLVALSPASTTQVENFDNVDTTDDVVLLSAAEFKRLREEQTSAEAETADTQSRLAELRT
ncbi:hypothetical protein DSL72_008970 [Monilinia vaccinii-corymbosi]|uniref:DUF7918 domain-containing protein n=1 Tax=Monilinia vaccinii-corymbosi TaxID=61207 RepID=A0A8A3PRT4_9HELO|nr:hypothetical protein DSL72_008970 [Monilinia vaccinii-corymbosi]